MRSLRIKITQIFINLIMKITQIISSLKEKEIEKKKYIVFLDQDLEHNFDKSLTRQKSTKISL